LNDAKKEIDEKTLQLSKIKENTEQKQKPAA
jgi:hypothetical protein